MDLDSCLDLMWAELHAVAADDALFSFIIETAFGEGADASAFKVAWLEGNGASMPAIEIRPAAEINGANGAFAAATGRIYLAREFVEAHADQIDRIVAVLLEEYGHFIDTQINHHDSVGDEGAIFAHLVQRKSISLAELQQLKGKDDKVIVELDSRLVEIEQNSASAVPITDPLAKYTFKSNANENATDLDGEQHVKGARRNDALYAWQLLSD
jgi:hypothetical protein